VIRKVALLSLLLQGAFFCSPSRNTVLKDVERNYTATGFLDTDTFQVRCAFADGASRLEACDTKLLEDLVAYKERYDREAYQRRTHPDFLPFVTKSEVAAAAREKWRAFYKSLAEKRTRVVFERQGDDGFEGTYRLRVKDLIYRVQKAE
jgi:hypothetical protein